MKFRYEPGDIIRATVETTGRIDGLEPGQTGVIYEVITEATEDAPACFRVDVDGQDAIVWSDEIEPAFTTTREPDPSDPPTYEVRTIGVGLSYSREVGAGRGSSAWKKVEVSAHGSVIEGDWKAAQDHMAAELAGQLKGIFNNGTGKPRG